MTRRKKPTYTIGCYVKNCAADLEGFVSGLAASSVVDEIEVILLDDGSSDGSGEVSRGLSERYGRWVRAFSFEERGLAVSRNAILKRATGTVFTFMEPRLPSGAGLALRVSEFRRARRRHPSRTVMCVPAIWPSNLSAGALALQVSAGRRPSLIDVYAPTELWRSVGTFSSSRGPADDIIRIADLAAKENVVVVRNLDGRDWEPDVNADEREGTVVELIASGIEVSAELAGDIYAALAEAYRSEGAADDYWRCLAEAARLDFNGKLEILVNGIRGEIGNVAGRIFEDRSTIADSEVTVSTEGAAETPKRGRRRKNVKVA